MVNLSIKFSEIHHNLKFYGEFYAICTGLFVFQVVFYLLAIYGASQRKILTNIYSLSIDIIAEIVIRVFFYAIHTILLCLLENNLDFYQFRWITILFINATLNLLSIQVNPLHSLLAIAIVTHPILNVLHIQDLKKVDPMSIILQKRSQSQVLPESGLITNSAKREFQERSLEFIKDFILSVTLLVYLLKFKDDFTPDFFHFIMCLHEDYCHFIWIMLMWLTYKCFLIRQSDSDKLTDEARITVIFVQGIIGLLIAFELTFSQILIYTLMIGIFTLRLKYSHHLNTVFLFFVFIYLTQNLLVNLIDFVLYKNIYQGFYYHDDDFLRSFSYKMYQALIGLIFALLYGQAIYPTTQAFSLDPNFYLYIFYSTIPCCGVMFFTFLYELTYEPHERRSRIYKTELTKVFFTVVYFYLISMIFANWLQSLRKFIVDIERSQKALLEKQQKKTEAAKSRDQKFNSKSLREQQIERFTLTNFTLSDIFDLAMNQFDQFLLTECFHFKDQIFMNVMKDIQNISAIIFFVLIHLPLSRIHILFSLLTAIVPLILDKRNKEGIFSIAFQIVYPGQEIEILRKFDDGPIKVKLNRFLYLKELQRSTINFTVFYIGLFFAIVFNYLNTLYLGSVMAIASEVMIKAFDRIGIEVHFIRLIYYTVFDIDIHDKFKYEFDFNMLLDLAFFFGMIVPLFALSLRYLTHTPYEPYMSKTNALVAPILFIPMFLFTSWDILFLSVIILLVNFWISWKQLDIDEYSWHDYYKDQARSDYKSTFQSVTEAFSSYAMADPLTMSFGGSSMWKQ